MDEEPERPEQVPRLAILTPAQKEYILAKLSEARHALFRVRDVNHFNRATVWALKVFAFDIAAADDFFPDVSFGASFVGLTGYVSRRIVDADAEEVIDEDQANL